MTVVKAVKGLFIRAVHYCNYFLSKKSTKYHVETASVSNKMTEKIAVQMKDQGFNGKYIVSIITFLQVYKAGCGACNIYEDAVVWPFEYYPNDPVESIFRAGFALPTKTARTHERCLTSYSALSTTH